MNILGEARDMIQLRTDQDVLDLLSQATGHEIHHVRVYPGAARALLEINTKNRSASQPRVNELAKHITEGRWQLINNGIGVDKNGDLIDGQHRLLAVILANRSAEFFIHLGLESDTRYVIDTGKRRNGADALAIAGYGKGMTDVAAAASLLYRYQNGALKFSGGPDPQNRMSHDVLVAFTEKLDQDALHWATSEAHSAYRIVRGNRSAWLAFYYLVKRRDPYAAITFADRVKLGENLHNGDPELTLRNMLARVDSGYRNDWYLCIFIKAWNARQQGKKIQVLRVVADEKIPEIK